MAYTGSKAWAGRGSILNYSTNPPSVAYQAISELKQIQLSGSKFDLADVTNFQSGTFREFLPTLADNGELSISGNMLPNDSTETDLVGFFNNATLITWQVLLPPQSPSFVTSLGNFVFKGYVVGVERQIHHDKEATITIKIKITGAITFTAGS